MTQTAAAGTAELSKDSSDIVVARKIPFRFFAFFLISGFCGLLYEIIWVRLAMAEFGVTITMTSTVISVFMAGLGVGSWAVGRLTRRLDLGREFPRLRAYALTELLIGIGSLVVPYELLLGRHLLESAGLSSSLAYYALAGLWLSLALLPWCICMGATFPVAMWAIREHDNEDRSRSFSYLYVANVVGALLGAVLPLFLIEIGGFRNTLRIGGVLNLLLASWAFTLSKQGTGASRSQPRLRPDTPLQTRTTENSTPYLVLLFATGLTSMGLEVVWIRLYTPYLGTEVYAFATILGIYLAATAFGSAWYRLQKITAWKFSVFLWATLGLMAVLPLKTANPRFTFYLPPFALPAEDTLRALLGIAPFALWLGFLTPMLVDRISRGDPDKAGSAYAVNVTGCIIGPLLAGFLLLPTIGERWSLGILAAVCFLAGAWFVVSQSEGRLSRLFVPHAAFAVSLVIAVPLLERTHSWESQFKEKLVLRDNTATIIATGQGMQKRLLINGVGITTLTPITKIMAHLPLALLQRPPERALDICFGMGTTYRSLLTWGIHAEAAELVPSVPAAFHYFHPDAPQVLQSPFGQIVVDDGRRYLERTHELYDVITIDPPPPIQAAGSSLLYTKEFYSTAKRRLRPGGILAQWLPAGNKTIQASQDPAVLVAVTKAIQESFPYVRAFVSIEGWGVHLLASDSPIPARSAEQLALQLPARAQADLVEWGPNATAEAQFAAVLENEISPEALINRAPTVQAITDDRPINEYYLLRNQASGAR